MQIHPYAQEIFEEVKSWRHHLHAHPENSLHEYETADFVKCKLDEMGIAYQQFAETGIVAKIQKGTGNRAIGFRCELDALPMTEDNTFAHKSTRDGCMHACGHDGHTAILLGTAKALQQVGTFDGIVYLVFQPAEEGGAGAEKMMQDGLFQACAMEEIYALHNWPGMPVGQCALTKGPIMAAADTFYMTIHGQGAHAAIPQTATDPIVIASQLVMALQTIVSRNVDPMASAVVSATILQGGSAHNVIPDTVNIEGTVRVFRPETQDLIERRISEIAKGFGIAFGCNIDVCYRHGYPATINHDTQTEYAGQAMEQVVGKDNIIWNSNPCMGAEDFSYMLEKVEGNYLWIGAGEDASGLHTTTFDFNDDLIPIGVSYWLEMAKLRLPEK